MGPQMGPQVVKRHWGVLFFFYCSPTYMVLESPSVHSTIQSCIVEWFKWDSGPMATKIFKMSLTACSLCFFFSYSAHMETLQAIKSFLRPKKKKKSQTQRVELSFEDLNGPVTPCQKGFVGLRAHN